ncbi:DUF2577 family protein [Lysinibacillus sp. RC79]|uniref:DUF2577 family protein n=1 Tax=Lysinibacillus sp. RC79 TaxID=3156296 RepID=UPI00351679C6
MAFKPMIPREGTGSSRIIGLIQALGYNPGGTLQLATVTSEYPNFSIRLDRDEFDTPDPFIVCNPELFPHTETVKINGQPATIEYPQKLVKGARVFVFEAEHQQLLYVLSLSDE